MYLQPSIKVLDGLAAPLDNACPVAGQTVEPRFVMRVRTCAQTIGTHLIGLLDMTHSNPAAGGAGQMAIGIDASAVAKDASSVGRLH